MKFENIHDVPFRIRGGKRLSPPHLLIFAENDSAVVHNPWDEGGHIIHFKAQFHSGRSSGLSDGFRVLYRKGTSVAVKHKKAGRSGGIFQFFKAEDVYIEIADLLWAFYRQGNVVQFCLHGYCFESD